MKQLNDVYFDPDKHKYFTTEQTFISVTTFLKQFKTPFDREGISLNKAVELIDKDLFLELKSKVGFKNVSRYFLSNGGDKNILLEKQKELLNEWDLKSKESMAIGTEYHNKKEQEVINSGEYLFRQLGNKYSYMPNLDVFNKAKRFNNKLVIPEAMVFSKTLGIAGQMDLLLIDHDLQAVFILDYKTNQEITIENKFQKLKDFDVDECDLNYYALQLIMYEILLKDYFKTYFEWNINYSFKHFIIHVPKGKEEDRQFLSVPYLLHNALRLKLNKHFTINKSIDNHNPITINKDIEVLTKELFS